MAEPVGRRGFLQDLLIEQGAYFALQFEWRNEADLAVDLTNWEAHMEIRPRAGANTLWLEIGNVDPLAGIVLGGVAGTIDLYITDEQTATLSKNGSYDLFLRPAAGDWFRFAYGAALVDKRVTINA